MKTRQLKVAVPDDMDDELATLTACNTLLNRLKNAEQAQRIVSYLSEQFYNPRPQDDISGD